MIYLLIIHIIFGFTSLLSSFGAMISAKGQYWHRLFGTCFFYGMTGIFVTAIPLALIKNTLFLFLVAVFSYYLTLSGWRYAKNRTGIPSKLDWAVSLIMLLTSLIMITLGIIHFNLNNYETMVLPVFGGIGCILSLSDLRTYRTRTAKGKQRIVQHLTAMLGATIATLTAFSVTNIPLKPPIFLWLGPTVLLVPVISWWTYKVTKHSLKADQ